MSEGALIAVNDGHVPTRHFSLCHELGHHLLGHTERFHLSLSDGAQPAQDYRLGRAANEFAADLPMPRRLLAEANAAERSTAELASQFEVSEIAMGYRLLNLGLR